MPDRVVCLPVDVRAGGPHRAEPVEEHLPVGELLAGLVEGAGGDMLRRPGVMLAREGGQCLAGADLEQKKVGVGE